MRTSREDEDQVEVCVFQVGNVRTSREGEDQVKEYDFQVGNIRYQLGNMITTYCTRNKSQIIECDNQVEDYICGFRYWSTCPRLGGCQAQVIQKRTM
jgi:hypothetical protein